MPPTLGNGKICYVQIPTDDIPRSAAFYSGVFGWSIRKRGDGATAFDRSMRRRPKPRSVDFGRCYGHYRNVAWLRGRDDERQSGFSIEFEDEDEGLDAAAWDEALQTGEAAGAEVVRGHGGSRWTRMPRRYRVALAAGALALVAGSVAGVQGVRAARERARDRFALAVVGDHYQPVVFSYGLNMSLTLVDNGPAPVTVEFLQVSQPGL